MNYREALEWVQSLNSHGIRLGLGRIRRLLDLLGRPDRDRRVIHVAGTNGKGSVCACLESVFLSAGFSPGLYTSPHLQRFTERVRVQGREIPESEAAALLGEVRRAGAIMEAEGAGHPTHFEACTALAWLWFARAGADPVILETGLGGTHDATNTVVCPLVSVITGIELDHTERLGKTIPEIAGEKAGIIKPGRPVVAAGPKAALEVVARAAAGAGAPLYCVRESGGESGGEVGAGAFEWTALETGVSGGVFDLEGPGFGQGWLGQGRRVRREALRIGLLGRHQIANAAVAAAAVFASGLSVAESDFRHGLAGARWPGRLELFPGRGGTPDILLDGAHNPDGARALAAAVRSIFPGRKAVLVIGTMADKDVSGILRELVPLAAGVYATAAAYWRSMDPETLARLAPGSAAVRPASEALRQACLAAGPGGLVLAAGSLFLVGEIRALLE